MRKAGCTRRILKPSSEKRKNKMILKIVSFTDKGRKTENLLKQELSGEIWISRQDDENLSDFVRDAFFKRLPIVFVSAAGIAVREISPFVRDKLSDSPVLVIDERGKFVVPILSGHFGGANEIAKMISEKIGVVPVITTATDVENKFAVDVFARKNQLKILNRASIKKVSAKILKGEKLSLWVNPKIIIGEDLKKNPPQELTVIEVAEMSKIAQLPDIVINFEQNLHSCDAERKKAEAISESDTLFLSPKTLCVGIGCKKGKTFEELKDFLESTLENLRHCEFNSIASISSIDIKKNETGLLTLAQFLNVPFLTFSAEELKGAKGDFSESDFVEKVTGVSNVCERAAVLAAGGGEKLLLKKTSSNGMTIAVSEKIPKIKTW